MLHPSVTPTTAAPPPPGGKYYLRFLNCINQDSYYQTTLSGRNYNINVIAKCRYKKCNGQVVQILQNINAEGDRLWRRDIKIFNICN